jgi:branched-chain amino acid transport system permease protein
VTAVLQFMISGIASGCVFGLVGIGFAVIFNASGIVNFGQGAFVMLGGILTYVLYKAAVPLAAAALVAVLLTALVGAAFELAIIRPLFRRKTPLFVMILATLAFSVVAENVVLHAVSDQPLNFPAFTPGDPYVVGGVAIARQVFWVIGASLLLVLALGLVYRLTLFGKAMRACAVNPEVASLLAIPVERMLSYSFALSAALGAIGGILITPLQYTAYHISVPIGVNGFIAAILGGLGNPGGAFVGGIVLGVLQAYAVLFFDAGYKEIVAFSVLLAFMYALPGGLFGSLVED